MGLSQEQDETVKKAAEKTSIIKAVHMLFEISFHKKIKGQIPRTHHKANSVLVKNYSSLFLPQALTKASKTDVYNSGCVLHADLTVKQVNEHT